MLTQTLPGPPAAAAAAGARHVRNSGASRARRDVSLALTLGHPSREIVVDVVEVDVVAKAWDLRHVNEASVVHRVGARLEVLGDRFVSRRTDAASLVRTSARSSAPRTA